MFEDSLVESSGRLRQCSPWTTAASFTIQTALAGFVILLSLLYTDALPIHTLIRTVEAPPLPPRQQSAPATHEVKLARAPTAFEGGVLTVPRDAPKHAATIRDEQPTSEGVENPLGSVPYGIAGAPLNNVISQLLPKVSPTIPKIQAEKVRVSSGIAQGLLIRQVRPQYPTLALQARIQGTVVLQATIGKDGTVQDLRVLSGHPLLTGAAIDAVRQWRYRPYYLNNEPVAVDTQINVNFTLASE
jgi:periplasmic protein TonB